ncbi:hypothetical protein NPIL_679221 [Nephila pilipes]|uniref:Uncharacterized protein n=1 Tax=Nephila pilipes TaxID=299642 RepID=A0A8X6NLH7_NEPPI|nr:hypothetical protein NPIL_679221 [Nephila pilipes]
MEPQKVDYRTGTYGVKEKEKKVGRTLTFSGKGQKTKRGHLRHVSVEMGVRGHQNARLKGWDTQTIHQNPTVFVPGQNARNQ